MQKRTKIYLGVAALVLAGAGVAGAAGTGMSDDDTPITGAALEKATAAALAHTGGGQVTETEMDDDESAYEVEVLGPDGHHVEVHLDDAFQVVSQDADDNDDAGVDDVNDVEDD